MAVKGACVCIVPLEACGEPPRFIGTGFITVSEEGELNIPILVTSKHVVEDKRVQYRWNLEGEIYRRIVGEPVEPDQLSFDWVYHPDNSIDIATAIIPGPSIPNEPTSRLIGFSLDSVKSVDEDELGESVLYFGFPLGEGASIEHLHLPVVRSGILSQIPEGVSFIIEANVFPGSSGSPVLKNMGTDQKIIGVVSSYIPYRDIAVSTQTGNVKVIFEENSGLASVTHSKYITETINSDEFQEKATPIIEHMCAAHAG